MEEREDSHRDLGLDTYNVIFRHLQNHNYIRIPSNYLSFEKYLSKFR